MKYIALLFFVGFKIMACFCAILLGRYWLDMLGVFPDMLFSTMFLLVFLFGIFFVFIVIKESDNEIVLHNMLYKLTIKIIDIKACRTLRHRYIIPIPMQSFYFITSRKLHSHIIVHGCFTKKMLIKIDTIAKKSSC